MEILLVWILFALAWINPKIPIAAIVVWLKGKGEKNSIIDWFKSSIIGFIGGVIISSFIVYFIMPPTLPIVVIPLFFGLISLNICLRWVINKDSQEVASGWLSAVSLVVVICAVLVFIFAGSFYANELHKIPEVAVITSGSVDKISLEHIRTVPKETAEWKADKKVGDIGYKVETREAHIQFRDNELKWLVPLEYGGPWKAYKYSDEGTEGYIKVSAEESFGEAERVTGFNMKYLSSGVFSQNLQRHIYFNYPGFYQKESVFQLDDTGKPIFVTMLTKPTIGYTGEKPEGIVMTDVQSGEISFYDMESVPSYIQRVMDEELTETYLSWWGEYVHGFWNAHFSQRDVKRPTGGISVYTLDGSGEIKISEGSPDVFLVWGKDDKPYWFTSITTAGRDFSMVGYTLTDIKTGKTAFYKTEGYFNDIGAAKNVQQHEEVSKVMGFRVSQPIMYIIEGNETWIIPVLASTNEIRAFGVVHGRTGTTFVKNNLEEALTEYKEWLTGKPAKIEEMREISEEIIASIVITRDGQKQEIPVYRNSTITIFPR